MHCFYWELMQLCILFVVIDASVIKDSEISNHMSMEDQVLILSQQVATLMAQREEDHKMFENTVRKLNHANSGRNTAVKEEINTLREEVHRLSKSVHSSRDHVTIDWLRQSVTEIRSELAELQEATSNMSRNVQHRLMDMQDIHTMKTELQKMQIEWTMQQEAFKTIAKELSGDNNENVRRLSSMHTIDFIKSETGHHMYHLRFMRQQIRRLEQRLNDRLSQTLATQNREMASHLRGLESEQKRLMNGSSTLAQQVANLDKLHGSMLELLEDVEGIQSKVDREMPVVRREIAKVEFSAAQLASEQNLLREEGHNAAKSIQAIAFSVSTLQEEAHKHKQMQTEIEALQSDMIKYKEAAAFHRKFFHNQIYKIEFASLNRTLSEPTVVGEQDNYEVTIKNPPSDCSQLSQNQTGLFVISPGGMMKPMMVHCDNKWTTVQKRINGHVDFNRTWNEYAQGFGTPAGEFWIGNEALYQMTRDNCTSLKVVMRDIYDHTWIAQYSHFAVGGRDDGYRLSVSGFSGNASDAFDYQNHMQFSAVDDDRDISNTHCAGNYEGGWWFSHCQHANLNGRYNLGLTWFDEAHNEWIMLKTSEMLITTRSECDNFIEDGNR